MVHRVIRANEHLCPVCERRTILIWRASCHSCYHLLPIKFRATYTHAWQKRITRQVEWQEARIEARQWWLAIQKLYEEEA